MRKRSHIEGAMRNPWIVFFLFGAMMLFGVWCLPHLNKDEFPQFTIRQGVVAAIYPGATAEEVEAQVTKPLEAFLFTYSEIDKRKTYSYSQDGVVYVFAELRRTVERKDEAWAKIRAGLELFKSTSLPKGVLAVAVIDDFGNTSSILMALESTERSPRELETVGKTLSDKLRAIPSMGKIKIIGQQTEEIAVEIDLQRLTRYGINQTTLLATLATQGFRTIGGSVNVGGVNQYMHVNVPFDTEENIGNQIVLTDPTTGAAVRLKDVATITRRYQTPDKRLEYDDHAALLLNLEMEPGNNIVAFGEEVDKVLAAASADYTVPSDVRIHRITDQPKVVDSSVRSFLRDILLSILVVIAVMLILFPMRTALVSSTGIVVCIAICWGFMYLIGIEMNTVTLAALIVVLGMIVDDSVIVIDGYSGLLEKGHSRWYSAVVSTSELFIPMTIATCSISGMFFPMTRIITGPLGEFVQLFPWAVFFALTASIFWAVWAIPALSVRFIHKRDESALTLFGRLQNRFFEMLQHRYQQVLSKCFARPWLTLSLGLGLVILGGWIFTRLNVQMMPKAERDCFAVEIHLREGSTIEETAEVAAQLSEVLRADSRVKSVTSFIGQASPRFHATYSPQMARSNYAQFIVNTISTGATAAVLKEYAARYENAFPNAFCRFKQMDYQAVKNPLEVYVHGSDYYQMQQVADSIRDYMLSRSDLSWVHTDFDDVASGMSIRLKEDEASRLGVTEAALSVYLGNVFAGTPLTQIWEDDYAVPVVLYAKHAVSVSAEQVEDIPVPTAYPGIWVPLRQVAEISPDWHASSLTHRNGIRTITVGADMRGNAAQPKAQKALTQWVNTHLEQLPDDISIEYGGLTAANQEVIPELAVSVLAALLVMFAVLLYHFGKLRIALLALSTSILTIFGACLGLYIFGLDFSITALLGIVSLIGIIVRNAIMMYEYAEMLRHERHLDVRTAAYEAGLRRMRPIFLTSATTALGVIPMIVAHTSLWMPMGVVICFGTIFTLPLVVTVLPVAYWKVN